MKGRAAGGMEHVPRKEAIARDRFHDILRAWFDESDAGELVGDTDVYDGTDWVWVKFLGNRYHLNADTTHEGVGGYLQLVAAHGETLSWSAVAGARGKVNKVAFGPDGITVPDFNLYRAP
ncbi:MAG TPA: hypothetical protein VE913_00445, partial [Longimicrobium sp.]|nr:hypothetical protein [Longimicrobium sp.]